MKNKKKNGNYKISFGTEQNAKKSAGNKFLITFVCIFLAIVLVVGIIVGVVSATKNRNAAVKYKDSTLTEAELSFFASYCKYDLLAKYKSQGAVDTPDFWSSKCPIASSYGELLKYNTKRYVSQMVVLNYIFDKYSRLTSSDKEEIEKAVNEIFVYRMDSDEQKFNEEAEANGFSYSDYYGIVTKIYKYNKAYQAFYAANASSITNDANVCLDYYGEYSKVMLLFINTEKDYKLDENGKRIVENNAFVYTELSEEEKAKRLADAETVRQAIKNYEIDASGQINDTMLADYIAKYPSPYGAKDKNGFYLHENSSYTAWLGNEQKMVVNEALYMEIDERGGYREVKTEQGVCFIYKMPINVTDGAYLDASSDSCFLDFFEGVVSNEFENTVLELIEEVELREAYEALDLVKIAQLNHLFIPRI